MKASKIYKGVPLTNGKTEEMIDTVIEKRGIMNTSEIAELVGLESFRIVNAIYRSLNRVNGTTKFKSTESKSEPIKLELEPIKPKFEPRVKEAKNTFRNYSGSGKEKARKLITNAVIETSTKSSNNLTLPAEYFLIEKSILDKKLGHKFTAVERDKETYVKMIKYVATDEVLLESIIGIVNKTVADQIVNDKENTYSNMILDYCGFVDTFHDEIDDIMYRKLVKKNGYITITLAENDRHLGHPNHITNYSNAYITNCCLEEEKKEMNGNKVTTALIKNLVFNNNGYKLVEKFSYRDKTVNMILFIIKRID